MAEIRIRSLLVLKWDKEFLLIDFTHLGADPKGFAFVLNFINHFVTTGTIAAIYQAHNLQQLFYWTPRPGINDHVKD